MTPLEAATAAMDRTVTDTLGDTILYTPASQPERALTAFVDYSEERADIGQAGFIGQDMQLDILRVDLADEPGKDDRVTLPKVTGITYFPVSVRRDESGSYWRMNLKRVRVA